MTKTYDDSRWGIEKHLNFQEVDLANAPATTILRSFYFTEDVTITEFAFSSTVVISAIGGASGRLQLAVSGGNALAELNLTAAADSGNLFRTTTIATPTAISNGSVLQLVVGASVSTGKGVPYIKYRERY